LLSFSPAPRMALRRSKTASLPVALSSRIALGRCRQHTAPQARIDRPVDKRRASHPLPRSRRLPSTCFIPPASPPCASPRTSGPNIRAGVDRCARWWSESCTPSTTRSSSGPRERKEALERFTGLSVTPAHGQRWAETARQNAFQSRGEAGMPAGGPCWMPNQRRRKQPSDQQALASRRFPWFMA
jgi:hypothetical protein